MAQKWAWELLYTCFLGNTPEGHMVDASAKSLAPVVLENNVVERKVKDLLKSKMLIFSLLVGSYSIKPHNISFPFIY